MNTGNSTREQMLRRIRLAIRDVPAGEQSQDAVVPRDYRHSEIEPHEEVVQRFIERIAEYKVTVRRVEDAALSEAIAASCRERNVLRLVVPADVPAQWLPPGVELLYDDNTLSYEQLDKSDGVMTGCALGIAQTGTIVLDDWTHQGRRVITLLPDYHLCVVYENQLVGLVPEAITRLHDAVVHHSRPITFISGPSATSDIELNRVEGVHGPRTLDVLVVRGPDSHTP